MTPSDIVFTVIPVGIISVNIILKWVLNKYSKSNIAIIVFTYIVTNVLIYMLVEGAFLNNFEYSYAKGFKVFSNLTIFQWFKVLLIPNVFSFMYIAISFLLLWLIDKMVQSKKYIEE